MDPKAHTWILIAIVMEWMDPKAHTWILTAIVIDGFKSSYLESRPTFSRFKVKQQALDRVEFSRLDQLSELFSQPEAIGDYLQHFAPLTESRRQQALWLLDRAKSINPNFDLATATQKIQETWQESKNQIVQTFVNEGDKKVREQQSDEALQQYRYALQLDPTLPFTPESRVQDKNPGSPP